MSKRMRLGELLLQAGVIDDFQLRSALGEQKRWGRRLGMTLIKMGFLEEPDLVRALAAQLEMPVAHLAGKRIHADVLALVPAELAEKHMCLPLFVKEEPGGKTLYVAMENPCDLAALDDLAFRTGMRVKPVLVGPSELCEAIDRFYLGRGQHAIAPTREPVEPATSSEVSWSDAEDPTPDPGDTAPLHDASRARESGPAPDAAREEPAAAAAAAPARAAREDEPDGTRTRLVLRALTQLLVEKGLLDKAEIQERIRQLQDALDARD